MSWGWREYFWGLMALAAIYAVIYIVGLVLGDDDEHLD